MLQLEFHAGRRSEPSNHREDVTNTFPIISSRKIQGLHQTSFIPLSWRNMSDRRLGSPAPNLESIQVPVGQRQLLSFTHDESFFFLVQCSMLVSENDNEASHNFNIGCCRQLGPSSALD